MGPGTGGPRSSAEWKALSDHFGKIGSIHLRDLFREDPARGSRFSIQEGNLYFDYSKNRINDRTVELLVSFAESSGLKMKISGMFTGEKINFTENRAVLHTALRNFSDSRVFVDGEDIIPDIVRIREKMRTISDKVRSGDWRGFSGKAVRNIVNIGIGGSGLGPDFSCRALKWYSDRGLNVRFVSNVDGSDLAESLSGLDPEETLFIVASKTFTTLETMTNAMSAKKWLNIRSDKTDSVSGHFIAITSNIEGAMDFGIARDSILEMRDWVGGRFSLASAIGLPLMIAIGYDHFMSFLKGMYRIDEHFRNRDFQENIPVLMALIGIWYINFFGFTTHAVLPYDRYLSGFPGYLQQCDMESNGKRVDISGRVTDYHTGPVVWGGPGTDSQHAFFQLLHQGTETVPADFIGFVHSLNELGDHHRKLMASCFAQTKALAFGRTAEEVADSGIPSEMVPFRVFPGNRPSNTILLDRLTPETLGMLIALYEHKIFTQGILWNINSFDQWGVELGKKIAVEIENDLADDGFTDKGHDPSTCALIRHFRDGRKDDAGP